MPLIRYIQKITRDPNFLVWRDAIYINADGRPQYLSLKLVSDIDALLQGKISEYIFKSEYKEVKFSCNEIKIIGRSLIAEYLFYEGNGNILHDTSGNKNNGTIYNAAWYQLSNGKWSLYFDGATAYVLVPHSSSFETITSAITIEVLQKVVGDTGNNQDNVHKENSFAGPRPEPSVAKYRLWLYIVGQGWRGVASSHSFLDDINKWTHLIGWYNGSEMRIYINNTLDASVSQSGQINVSTNPLGIGRKSTNTTEWFYGYIALVRIFNRAVTDQEREKLWTLAQIAVP